MQGLGYLVSTVSVFLLGFAAWLKPEQASMKALFLVLGMATSITGMVLRYLSHRNERAALAYATLKAEEQSSE